MISSKWWVQKWQMMRTNDDKRVQEDIQDQEWIQGLLSIFKFCHWVDFYSSALTVAWYCTLSNWALSGRLTSYSFGFLSATRNSISDIKSKLDDARFLLVFSVFLVCFLDHDIVSWASDRTGGGSYYIGVKIIRGGKMGMHWGIRLAAVRLLENQLTVGPEWIE